MTKVLIVSTNSDEAGAPRHIEFLINLLGEDINFYCIFGTKGPVSNRIKSKMPNRVFILGGMQSSISFFKDIFLFFRFIFLVLRIKPDLVHCHSTKAGIYGRILSIFTKKKILFTIHGWPWRGFSGWKYNLIVSIERFLMNYSKSHYIGVAKCLIDEARDVGIEIPPEKISIIYNTSLISNKTVSNKILNFKNERYFIMPARVSSAKDHKKLAMAFDKSDYTGKLLFAGEGTNKIDFINLITSSMQKKKHNLKFLGERDDIANLIFNSEFVALCSNFETFPLIIPEAARLCKPLILSKVGGNEEILENNFDALFASSLDEWTIAINSYCKKDNLNKISKNIKKTFNLKLNPDKTKKDILKIYKSLKTLDSVK